MLKIPLNMRAIRPFLIASMLTVTAINADAAPVIYTDGLFPPSGGEAAYLGALTAGGYGTLHEDFEDDFVWADSRTSISNPSNGTPQVNSQGILWKSNFDTNNIVTSDNGVGGSFGFYSSPPGDPDVVTDKSICEVPDPIPDQCFLHDGFVGTSDGTGTLYGVGAWINGKTGAEVALVLDGVQVDFGLDGVISSWTFLGVIDTAGFNSFEFREVNGKGLEVLTIRADDASLGVSAVPVPAALWLFGSGLLGLVGMSRRKKAA
jgi:hypothetical protein